VSEGALLVRPVRAGSVYAVAQRAPIDGVERVVLRRWDAVTAEPRPDVTLASGSLAVPYVSADGTHVIVSARRGTAEEYDWALYRLEDGARRADLVQREAAPGDFSVQGASLLRVSAPFGRRVGDAWVDEPRTVRLVDLTTAAETWTHAVRDTTYRGPAPAALP
jgi:hypothetical protein